MLRPLRLKISESKQWLGTSVSAFVSESVKELRFLCWELIELLFL